MKQTIPLSETLEMVDENDGKLNGNKLLIGNANQCKINGGNWGQEHKMVGSSVYGFRFDRNYSESTGKRKKNSHEEVK